MAEYEKNVDMSQEELLDELEELMDCPTPECGW